MLRGCDFFDFSQKATLKTTGLDAKKSSYHNKVTSSQNDKFKAKTKTKSNAAASGSQGGKKKKPRVSGRRRRTTRATTRGRSTALNSTRMRGALDEPK
jgi:hypothetical protein